MVVTFFHERDPFEFAYKLSKQGVQVLFCVVEMVTAFGMFVALVRAVNNHEVFRVPTKVLEWRWVDLSVVKMANSSAENPIETPFPFGIEFV